MAGRLGHIDGSRRVGHVPTNFIRGGIKNVYGFTGANFWLNAQLGLSNYTNGGSIESWIDVIGGLKYQGVLANQPLYVASNASYNNHPTVNFNTNAKFLESLVGITITGTMVFVANYATINGRNMVLGDTSTVGFIMGGNTNAGVTGAGYIAGSTPYVGTTETVTPKIVIVTPNRVNVNGTDEFTGAIPFTSNPLVGLGGTAVNNAQRLIGNIADVIHFPRIFSAQDCVQYYNNITSKYAL